MGTINTGYWMNLMDYNTKRTVFSVATDLVGDETFDALWASTGKMIWKKLIERGGAADFKLEIRPIQNFT